MVGRLLRRLMAFGASSAVGCRQGERCAESYGVRVVDQDDQDHVASPYSTGGGGTVLEHRYGAVLLAHLLLGDPVPEMGDDVVPVEVRFQDVASSPVDDLIVVGRTPDRLERRVSIGVRRAPKVTASDASTADLLKSYLRVVTEHWNEVRAGRWRLGLAVASPNPAVQQVGELAVIARGQPDEAAFRAAVAQPGRVSKLVRTRLTHLDALVVKAATAAKIGAVPVGELTWRLLHALWVRELRLEGVDGSDQTAVISRLQAVVLNGDASKARALFWALEELCNGYAPSAASVTEAMVRQRLSGMVVDRSRSADDAQSADSGAKIEPSGGGTSNSIENAYGPTVQAGSIYGGVDQRTVINVYGSELVGPSMWPGPEGVPGASTAKPLRRGRSPELVDSYLFRTAQARLFQSLGKARSEATLPGSAQGMTYVLSGLGGIGKTQIARAYWESVRSDSGVQVALWVNARSRNDVIRAYAQLAADVIGQDSAGDDVAARDLVDWLSSTDRTWLIVLDGLDDLGILDGDDLWPPATAWGQVIVTTRLRGLAPRNTTWVEDNVELLTDDESIAFLNACLRDVPDLLDGAKGLAESLEGLPLALSHAAAVMLSRGMTARNFDLLFQDEREKLSRLVPQAHERPGGYAATIATTWSVSVAQADEWSKSVARPLLSVASLLGSTGIPTRILHAKAVIDHLRELLGRDVDESDVDGGLKFLRQLSLVACELVEPVVFDVHGLVQRTTLDQIAEEDLARLAKVTADALDECWPDGDIDIDIGDLWNLRSHADALEGSVGRYLMTPATGCHPLLVKVGRSLGWIGLRNEARKYFCELATKAGENLGADHPDSLKIRRYAASALGHTPDWYDCIAEFDDLVEHYHRVGSGDNLDMVAARASRASYRARAGEVTWAVTELEEILAARQRLLKDPFDPLILTTRARLAHWKGQAGQSNETVSALESLLQDYSDHQPRQVQDILRTRASLATWRGRTNDHVGAAAEFRSLLQHQLRIYGNDRRETISTRTLLVRSYRSAGNRKEAKAAHAELIDALQRIVEWFETECGPDHPDTLARKAELVIARTYGSVKGREPSIAELSDHVAAEEELLGPENPGTLTTKIELAARYGRDDDPRRAVEELQEVLYVLEQKFPSKHPKIFSVLSKIARWQGESGDPRGAARTLRILLKRQEQALSRDHLHIHTTLSNLVKQHANTKDSLRLGEAIIELLSYVRRNRPGKFREILETQLQLAVWRADCGQIMTVVDELRRIVSDCEKKLAVDDQIAMNSRFQLARYLRATGRQDEANQILLTLLNEQRHALGAQDRSTRQTERTLESWRAKPMRTTPDRVSRQAPIPLTRHEESQGSDEELLTVLRTRDTVSTAFEPRDLDRILGQEVRKLTKRSRASGPLLEALALGFDRGVPRDGGVLVMMANALSAIVLVDDSDVTQLLAEAGPLITTDVDDGVTVHRLAYPRLARVVLSQAARRTRLNDELDLRLRQRSIAKAMMTADPPFHSYVTRNLTRHAVVGGCLDDLAKSPLILDHIDLAVLTEEVLRTSFGASEVPNAFSGVLQARHLLTGLSPADRRVVRALVTTEGRPGRLPELPGSAWTTAWVHHRRDPRHVTLTGRPARSRHHSNRFEVSALASAALPDGSSVLVVGHEAGDIELWNPQTARKIPAHLKAVRPLIALEAIALDDLLLLTAVSSTGVQSWNLVNHSSLYEPVTGFEDGLQAATTIRYRGRRVLALVEGTGHITLLDAQTGKVLTRSIAQHDHKINGICPFPSRRRPGDCVATAGDAGRVQIWETDPLRLTDTEINLTTGRASSVIAIHQHGKTVLWVGGQGVNTGMWDPYTGERSPKELDDPHRGGVPALTEVVLPDAQALVASGGEDDTVQLRDPFYGTMRATPLTGHTAKVRALTTVRLSGERTALVSSGRDSSVRMWDLRDAATLMSSRHDSSGAIKAITTACLGEDGALRLVVGFENGSLRQFDIGSGEAVGSSVRAQRSPVQMLVEASTPAIGPAVATIGENTVRVWDFSSSRDPITQFELPKGTKVSTSIKYDGHMTLATGDDAGTIRVWNPTDGELLHTIAAHRGAITSIVSAEMDEGTIRLISYGRDRNVRIWNPTSGTEEEPGIQVDAKEVRTLAVLPSAYGPILALNGHEDSGQIKLYDLAARSPFSSFGIEKSLRMSTLARIDDAGGHPMLVGLGRGSAIRLWRPGTRAAVHRLDIEGLIETSHVFGSHLALGTKRGLCLLNLTLGG